MVTRIDIVVLATLAVLAATGVSITALRAGEDWRWALLPILPSCLFTIPPFVLPTKSLFVAVLLLWFFLILLFGAVTVISIGMFLFDQPLDTGRTRSNRAPDRSARGTRSVSTLEGRISLDELSAYARLKAAEAEADMASIHEQLTRILEDYRNV